jgi:hypothetical protein
MNSTEIQQADQIWDILKILVMIVAALAPVLITLLVFRYKRIIKSLDHKYQANQKLIEKRIEIYDGIGPKLNDIFCFYCYNGNWKEITPAEILNTKKELDKEINISIPLFSNELNKKYSAFMYLCFISISGWEHEEKIKSFYELRQEHAVGWKDEWMQFFDTKNVVDAIKMKERYNDLIGFFKKEISV